MMMMRKLWMAAALVLGPLMAFGLGGARIARAQDASSGTGQGITIVGQGQVSAAPDVAYVNLGVQTDGKTAQEASQANATAMAAVIDAVKRSGVSDNNIRTQGINISPITAPGRPADSTPPQVVGYRAENTITVTIDDITRAGAVLDAGIGAGANVANGLRFGLKDAATLRRQALDQAARTARADADALASSLGLRVTGIRAVEDQGGQATPMARVAAADAGGASVPVQPGQLTVTASVRVVFNFA
jgi:uncharacterized protein YggE